MRKVILMRASWLIKTAFYGGFKVFMDMKEHTREQNKDVLVYRTARVVKKCFRAIKVNTGRSIKGKIVQNKNDFRKGHQFFKEW